MSAIFKCQNCFWLRYFRRFDLPEIDRSVFVYPCYFLFANRHSFNCSVGLPPGHGRQGSVYFNVHFVSEMVSRLRSRPGAMFSRRHWHFLRQWKHDLATLFGPANIFTAWNINLRVDSCAVFLLLGSVVMQPRLFVASYKHWISFTSTYWPRFWRVCSHQKRSNSLLRIYY